MERAILLILVIILMTQPAQAYYQNDTNYLMQQLNNSERILFGQNNFNYDPYTRLAMTEQRLFGTVQPGSFADRVNFVNKVINNSNQNSLKYAQNLEKRNKINKIRYILNDVLTGTMTGYTPPVHNPAGIYNNTTFPQTRNVYGNRNFITQTRVIIDD